MRRRLVVAAAALGLGLLPALGLAQETEWRRGSLATPQTEIDLGRRAAQQAAAQTVHPDAM